MVELFLMLFLYLFIYAMLPALILWFIMARIIIHADKLSNFRFSSVKYIERDDTFE